VAVEGGIASIRNSVLAGCTHSLLAADADAAASLRVARCVFGSGLVMLGTNRLNTPQWSELTNAAPGFADSVAETLPLAAPLYRLPTNSLNFRHADYGLTPGADALTTPYEGWQPTIP
jgi:hypothetical protein